MAPILKSLCRGLVLSVISWGLWESCLGAAVRARPVGSSSALEQRSVPACSAHLGAIVRLRDWLLPVPTTRGKARLPLEALDEQGKLWVIALQIAGQSERFLLDTGASTSLITTTLAARLGRPGRAVPSDQLQLAMAGDRCPVLQARLHRLPLIRAGLAETRGLTALELSGSWIPPGVSGILGWDFLRGYTWQIDPQRRWLHLASPQSLTSAKPAGAIALLPKAGVYLTPVTIAGQGPFVMLLDTGAESTFISRRIADHLPFKTAGQTVDVLGFCGKEAASLSKISDLQLGGHQLRNLEAVVLGESAILQSLQVDGILGQNVLNRFLQTWSAQQNGQQGGWLHLQLQPSKTSSERL
jgi:predicted aspartyl protease